MTLLSYIRDYLPEYFGVHPAYGKAAELVFHAELIDSKLFCQEQFETNRERAALGIPYQVDDPKKREHALDVLEIIVCLHRQNKHGEDHSQRIEYLKMNAHFTNAELELIMRPEDWWSP